MFVFIMMWILLVKLDKGLVEAREFSIHTKTTFWVGTYNYIEKIR